MKKTLLKVLSLSLLVQFAQAQQTKTKGLNSANQFIKCGTEIPSEEWKNNFLKDIEKYEAIKATQKGAKVIVNIPVIMHVIHNSSNAVGVGDNISSAQLISQIQVLNDDFKGLGYNVGTVPAVFSSLVADCEVNFVLAQRDELGNQLATPGIDRVSYQSQSFTAPGAGGYATSYINSTIKPNTIWDVSKYLNCWVLDLDNTLLGYATFPPGSTLTGIPGTFVGTTTTDGFVNDYLNWGVTAPANAPYNRGRTATHEIGHWLGLLHIWGDDGNACTGPSAGSDQCGDTPNQADENYGCPTHPSASCSNGGDMFMNFMDYTDDACMYMFTTNQKTRIVTALTTSQMRIDVASPSNLSGTPVTVSNPPTASFTATPNPTFAGTTVSLASTSTNSPTTYLWTAQSGSGFTFSSTSIASPTLTIPGSTTPGNYSVCLIATNTIGSDTACNTIVVNGSNTACDTLSNFETSGFVVSRSSNGGYISGHNGYLDEAKAEFYTYPSGNPSGITVTGMIIIPNVAKGTGSTNFRMWNKSTTTIYPNTVLATKAQINNTLTANAPNAIVFTTPVNLTVGSDFFVGASLTYASGDTIAFLLNDSATFNTAFEDWSGVGAGNGWYAFDDANAWGDPYHMAIFPTYCPINITGTKAIETGLYNNVVVYPNPSNGIINTVLAFDKNTDATINVTDIAGRLIFTITEKSVLAKDVKIDLTNEALGTYFVTVKTVDGITTKRVIIQK